MDKGAKQLAKVFSDKNYESRVLKLLIDCWNEPKPHFGGDGPHRYDSKSKICCYCGRPKGWKPISPLTVIDDVLEITKKAKGES